MICVFSSVAQSCLTLCSPMNRSMPGLPVHHQLPEFTQTHIHRVGDVIQPSHPLSSPSPSAPSPSQHESFPMSQFFALGGQSTGVSALASFLPKKSQGWSPSEWTGWISLQSKGLSRDSQSEIWTFFQGLQALPDVAFACPSNLVSLIRLFRYSALATLAFCFLSICYTHCSLGVLEIAHLLSGDYFSHISRYSKH